MKLPAIALLAFAFVLPIVAAEEHASSFDVESPKEKLTKPVEKSSGKFLTKGIGGDPVTQRFYTKDAVVVTRASGAKEKHLYVAVPLLFRVNSEELFDATSRENTAKVAQMLKDLGSATFAIEGHASAEGDAQRNRELSKLRALRIQALLREQGVPATSLARTEGFGADHAQHKDPGMATSMQLQEDRRVLIVRER
ncbi:MAG: OmpA family protein [Verrucomicrobiota bacterium]